MPADAGSPDLHARPPAGMGSVDLAAQLPASLRAALQRLWSAGHEAYVVGGSVRDLLLGRDVADWDVATSSLPQRTQELFPGSVYENRFGTVTVRLDGSYYQVTTFRREHIYADHRRPERVEFGAGLDEDLARRDLTINAIAWGGRDGPGATLHDPFGGAADLRAGLIRAVGDADERFAEDALRMVRAVRFAATLGFAVEPATLAAVARNAPLARHLSAERVQAELRRILEAPRPSVALRLLAETSLLEVLFPELAAQRGVPQNKVPGRDLWEHTLATVDAAPADRPPVRLAALLHDVGKPSVQEGGRFPGHETEGAAIAERVLRALAHPRDETERVVELVRQHMFDYRPAWSDAAVRRFLRRVGAGAVDDLLALREADNVGSGRPAGHGDLDELRARIAAEVGAGHPLGLADLAIHGDDLRAELGIAPGPEIGRILARLLERVITDPAANERARLLAAARRIHAAGGRGKRSR